MIFIDCLRAMHLPIDFTSLCFLIFGGRSLCSLSAPVAMVASSGFYSLTYTISASVGFCSLTCTGSGLIS